MITWLEKWRAKRAARKFLKSCAKNPSEINNYWTPRTDENGNQIKSEDGKIKYCFHPYEYEIPRRGENACVDIWGEYKKKEAKLTAKANYFSTKKEFFKNFLEKGNDYLKRLNSLDSPPIEPNIWYYIFLLIFSLIEMPFNMVAFRATGMSELLNIFLSFGLGIILMGLAHGIGIAIKNKNIVEIIIVGIFSIFGISLLYYLAIFRATSEGEILLFQSVTFSNLHMKVYFLISILIFSVAIIFSYKNHEGRDDVKKLLSEIRNIFRCKSSNLGKKVRRLELKVNKLERKINILENKKRELLETTKNKLLLIKNSVKTYINIYREEIRNRAYKYKELKGLKLESPPTYPSFKWRNDEISKIMENDSIKE